MRKILLAGTALALCTSAATVEAQQQSGSSQGALNAAHTRLGNALRGADFYSYYPGSDWYGKVADHRVLKPCETLFVWGPGPEYKTVGNVTTAFEHGDSFVNWETSAATDMRRVGSQVELRFANIANYLQVFSFGSSQIAQRVLEDFTLIRASCKTSARSEAPAPPRPASEASSSTATGPDPKLFKDCAGETTPLTIAEAIAGCTKLIEWGAHSSINAPGVLFTRGFWRSEGGQHKEAITDYTAALAAVVDDKLRAGIYASRGLSRILTGQEGEGEKDISRALALTPQNAVAFYARSVLHQQRKNYAAAVADSEETVRLAPTSSRFLNSACWLRAAYTRQDLAKARAHCDKAVSLDPKSFNALDSRGLLNLREKRFSQAWKDYDAAYRLLQSPHYLYGRGIAALRLGRTVEGNADLTEALRKDPKIAEQYAGYGVTREIILP